MRTRGPLLVLMAGQLLLAGCADAPAAKPANGSPTPSASAASRPAVGDCYTGNAIERYRSELRAITKVETCDAQHLAETVYVGTFGGTLAASATPPAVADQHAAWAECEKGAGDYLGDDWHGARADLVIFTPAPDEWSTGDRSFRCDLVEVKSDFGLVAPRTGSLKDGLRGARPLAITCLKLLGEHGDQFDGTAAAPCTDTHRLEYAGYATAAEGPYPADQNGLVTAFDGRCEAIVAKYTGMTASQFRTHRQLRSIWYGAGERHWELGDRIARCYVWLPTVPDVRRSVRGLGNHSL